MSLILMFIITMSAAASFEEITARKRTCKDSGIISKWCPPKRPLAVKVEESEMEQDNKSYASDQLIVKLKEGISPNGEFLKSYGIASAEKISKAGNSNSKAAKSLKKFGIDRLYLMHFPQNSDIMGVMKKLNDDPKVEYAEPDYIVKADVIPDDEYFGKLWGMSIIDAPEAWDLQTGSEDVLVAVIDSGIDYTHPDLAANMWINSGEDLNNNGVVDESDFNNVDDDGNGYIDDIRGWDFSNNDNDPYDDYGHGTHCAGTIGAIGNNGIGVAGVNWNVKIIPLKFLDSSGLFLGGLASDSIKAIEYSIMMNVDATNNSYGGDKYLRSEEDIISAANDSGMLLAASAGNRGMNTDYYLHYPSSYDLPNIISVAATNSADEKAGFSNYGAESVDLGAPGENIYSTKPNNAYQYMDGTSMATPHATGAIGLVRAHFPLITIEQIKARLLYGTDPIPTLEGKTVSGGRLNMYNSLETDNLAPSAISSFSSTGSGLDYVTLSWTATGDDGNVGTASFYDVRYSVLPITEENWDNAIRIKGEPKPQVSGTTETFKVTGLFFDTVYYFAMKAGDNVGNISDLSNTVSKKTASAEVIFADDMEEEESGWTHGGENDRWGWGRPTTGPGYAFSGDNVWATAPNRDYTGKGDTYFYLTSPSVNLPENPDNSEMLLMFQHYFNTEYMRDGGIVEISLNNGDVWIQIVPKGGYPSRLSYENPMGAVSAYTGRSGEGWRPAIFDLSEYAGENINIRFKFGIDMVSNFFPGWYIDDFTVLTE